jgi:hypothetical protein
MRAADIIRNILDLIDQIDCNQMPVAEPAHAEIEIVVPDRGISAENPLTTPVDQNHFKQVFDLLSADRNKMYSNSPAEVVAGIESVTTHAGGGWNGPKDPADLRAANSFSMFPNFQADKGQ